MEVTQRWYSNDNCETKQTVLPNTLIPEVLQAKFDEVDVSLAVKHVIAGETLSKFWRYNHLPPLMKPRFFQIHLIDGKHYLAWDSRNKSRLKRGENTLDFTDIAVIRSGIESMYLTRKNMSDNSVEIQYGANKFLRFQCPDADSWKLWFVGLTALRERASQQLKEQNISLPIHKLWLLLTNQDQTQLIDYGAITNLLSEMQVRCDMRYARMLCEDPYQIEYLEFEKLIGRLITSPIVLETYYQIAGGKDHMTEVELLDYLSDVQLEVDPQKTLLQLMQAVPAELTIPSGVNDVGFCRAMMSRCNSIWDVDTLKIGAHPLNLSATRYWIKTSYNPCFVHSWTIIKPLSKLQSILRDGYRCLEFDVYEESDKSLVIPTSYKPLRFVAVDKIFRVCKEYAFKKLHTPMFIFLSIDASLSSCAELGQKLKSIFGKELVQLNEMAKELGDKSEGKLDWDFNLDDFKDRFIFGGKRVNLVPCPNDLSLIHQTQLRHLEFQKDDIQFDELFLHRKNHFDVSTSRISDHGEYLPSPTTSLKGSNATISSPTGAARTPENNSARSNNNLSARSNNNLSARSLRYTGGQNRFVDRAKGLVALELRQYSESILLLEHSLVRDDAGGAGAASAVAGILDPSSEAELNHRKVYTGTTDQLKDLAPKILPNHLYKITPLNLLSTISTPPCFLGWKRGIQMISHFKTLGVAEWIQKGRFLENGRCGYILRNQAKQAGSKQKELIVRILGGRQLPIFGQTTGARHKFIVKVSLLRDGRVDEKRTSVSINTGLDPRWSDKLSFEIDASDLLRTAALMENEPACASLSMLVIEVCFLEQDSCNLLCGTAIPLRCIRLGLRWIPLWNLDGSLIPWAGLIAHTESRFQKGVTGGPTSPPVGSLTLTGLPDPGTADGSLPSPPSPSAVRRNSAKDVLMEQRRTRRMSVAAPAKLAAQPPVQRRASQLNVL